MSDDLVWSCVGKGFCSFRVKAAHTDFCRNPHSVTGLCNRRSCELANSLYATVTEEKGKVFLMIKRPERVNYPVRTWEKVELPRNYNEALEKIEELLQYHSTWQKVKAKYRCTKIFKYITRVRQLRREFEPQLETIKKKEERRERIRELKAIAAAKLETSIKQELLEKYKRGEYDDLYNFAPEEYEKFLVEEIETTKFVEDDADFDELFTDDDFTSESEMEDEIVDIEDILGKQEVEVEVTDVKSDKIKVSS
ncbi:hypothetical protein PCE1_004091 [Barthelona sp. PCE]